MIAILPVREGWLSEKRKINGTLSAWKRTLRKKKMEPMIDQLAVNPFLTVGGLAKRMKFAFSTAQRVVDEFEKKANLTKMDMSRQRNRAYCAKKILAILEAPALVGTLTGVRP